MGSFNNYQKSAVGLLIFTLLVLFIAKRGHINLMLIAATIFFLIITYMFPLVGICIAVPLTLIVWIKNSSQVYSYIQSFNKTV